MNSRILFRAVLVIAIFAMAFLRGFETAQLVGLALALVWALALPYVLRLIWRTTDGQPTWLRYVVAGGAALILLAGFAFGVRPLLMG